MTDQEIKGILDLKEDLMHAKNDASNFRWNLLRAMKVLQKIEPLLEELSGQGVPAEKDVAKALKALRVVSGKEIDWGNTLNDWWEEVKKENEAWNNKFTQPIEERLAYLEKEKKFRELRDKKAIEERLLDLETDKKIEELSNMIVELEKVRGY